MDPTKALSLMFDPTQDLPLERYYRALNVTSPLGRAAAHPLTDIEKEQLRQAIKRAAQQGAFSSGRYQRVQTWLPPTYAARMMQKAVRVNNPDPGASGWDYVAQPILDLGPSANIKASADLVNTYHDAPLAKFIDPESGVHAAERNRENFIKDVRSDMTSVPARFADMIREYVAKKHGISLSLGALLAAPAAASRRKERKRNGV